MGNIIVFENVSVDGYFADEQGGIGWATPDADIMKESVKAQKSVGLFMFGRVTYDMMARFWPTPAGKAASPAYAHILNSTPKVTISQAMKKAEWSSTTIMNELTTESITRLKEEQKKDIMIFGSGTIVSKLTELGLVDEYQLVINPVILGTGKVLFHDMRTRVNLILKKSTAFKSGVVLQQYNLKNNV